MPGLRRPGQDVVLRVLRKEGTVSGVEAVAEDVPLHVSVAGSEPATDTEKREGE